VLQAICLVLVLTLGRMSGTLFTITLVLTFFTWGEVFSLFPSVVADYYGTANATANYGVMYSAKGVASIIGGGIAALLFEALRYVDCVLLRKRRARAAGGRANPRHEVHVRPRLGRRCRCRQPPNKASSRIRDRRCRACISERLRG
jgi:hypothetical protein